MDIFLLTLASILILLGVIGSFLPVLPGPLTGWIGFLVFYLIKAIAINYTFLIITFIVALGIWILDYIIPAMGTKRFGGSKAGMIGTTVGLIVGIIAPIPFGIIIGPFAGALIGELLNKSDFNNALKAAFGSFLGFIASTFMKFIVSIVFLGLYITKVYEHIHLIF